MTTLSTAIDAPTGDDDDDGARNKGERTELEATGATDTENTHEHRAVR